MNRRFVNLIIHGFIGDHAASTLHRINPWRCFYPTTQQALAAASAAANTSWPIMEDARLPRPVMSFYKPSPPDGFGDIHFAPSGGPGSNDIISMDQDGNTLLFDAAARAIRVMPMPHSPKYSPVSVAVGDALYLLDWNPRTIVDEHSFEALVHHPRRRPAHSLGDDDETWYWRSLPSPPCVADEYYEVRKVGDVDEYNMRCYERNGKDPYVLKAYTVVGGSQIMISTEGGGTFSFDTTSGVWSEAGDWALPFDGRVEYAPELGLWFGFTPPAEGRRFGACDLGASSPTRPPVLEETWYELASPLPRRWAPVLKFVLPLGSGKFCVARMFNLGEEGRCPEKDSDFLPVETFVVFTGVEIERGTLRMIRHKSRRYSLSPSFFGVLL
ncbi:hypothetical protein HU200_041483 [Digitaria exilis]|uniref:Uncharacterized protein n=1 Tax=Digitaria exilis TaxID=1010633 RepID=A0A835EDL3_9POAL|nr:hypothetical protein HU200_041483 [Digitaria exilis]